MPRGRPKKIIDNTNSPEKDIDLSKEKIVIREVIREIEKPRLEGYELYKKLQEVDFPQGGVMGNYMEDPNGTEKVYVPHVQEVLGFFTGNPDKWEGMRDGIIRTYIELNGTDNNQ